jgi:hypothetical protein
MLFKPDSIDAIVRGEKTQTRRICKEAEQYDEYDHAVYMTTQGGAFHWNWANGKRLKWQVGRDYAVCPGRGKPGVWINFNHPCYGYDIWQGNDPIPTDNGLVDWQKIAAGQGYEPLRIVITAIRKEPLQAISEEDAIAEGCKGHTIYTSLTNEGEPETDITPRDEYRDLWDAINGRGSWASNPDVWVLTFAIK